MFACSNLTQDRDVSKVGGTYMSFSAHSHNPPSHQGAIILTLVKTSMGRQNWGLMKNCEWTLRGKQMWGVLPV